MILFNALIQRQPGSPGIPLTCPKGQPQREREGKREIERERESIHSLTSGGGAFARRIAPCTNKHRRHTSRPSPSLGAVAHSRCALTLRPPAFLLYVLLVDLVDIFPPSLLVDTFPPSLLDPTSSPPSWPPPVRPGPRPHVTGHMSRYTGHRTWVTQVKAVHHGPVGDTGHTGHTQVTQATRSGPHAGDTGHTVTNLV